MKLAEYCALDGLAINTLIRKNEVSVAEINDLAAKAINIANTDLNAVTIRSTTVPDQTKNVDIEASPVSGVPFLLKDANVYTEDMPTTFSCRFFSETSPQKDSLIVSRWRNAGLVIHGKTNTPEFAEDYVCEPSWRGATLNPWDPALTTGGSSGGAGAAVASGMVPIAHGTDLGGSIRIPAACCGVFGFKPTSGLCPTNTSHQELSSGLNSDHVLTRSVRDSAAVLDLTALPVSGSRYPIVRRAESFLSSLENDHVKLRIGVCTKTPDGIETSARLQLAVEKVSRILELAGHELVPWTFPNIETYGEWFDRLCMFDICEEIERQIKFAGREPKPDELEALTRHIRSSVDATSGMQLHQARTQLHQTSLQLMQSMQDIDLLLTPALGTEPVSIGTFDSRTSDFAYSTWAGQGWKFAPFSIFCNVTGQPAASIPVLIEDDLLPGAVQLAGHTAMDHQVLQVSAMLEQELAWQTRRPPTWVGQSS